MPSMTDATLIIQLEKEEASSFGLLYKLYFPSIDLYVRKNNGTREDAEDVFQEAMVVLLGKVRQPHFVLTSSLKTFFYAIAKNLWLKKLRDNHVEFRAIDLPDMYDASQPFGMAHHTDVPLEQKVESWLQRVTKHCQRVLKAIFFYQQPMDNLMASMGWKNKHTAANQKYKCIEQVKREIRREV